MNSSAIDAAEAELQQELREMFTVDTQQHLETYFNTIQQLNPQSWAADIQQLYRAIHTVKGGAVTVAADAMLHAAIVLEDLLGDLRYLESAPILADGVLGQILLEAGELLSSSIEITETGDLAIERVQPTVRRLEQLRDRVKQLYLLDWTELKQVHQEFAEQGLDLVVLDLEIALSKIPDRGLVSAATIETAQATIAQLNQIGIDLELAEDWTILLQDCEQLIAKPDCQLWTSVWFEYFEILKICVKNSGAFTDAEIDRLDALTIVIQSCDLDLLDSQSIASNIDLSDSLSIFFFDEESEDLLTIQSTPAPIEFSGDLLGTLDTFFFDEEAEQLATIQSASAPVEFSGDLLSTLDTLFQEEEVEQLPAIQSTSEPVEVSGDLLGTLDTFCQEEEVEQLPAIQSTSEPVEVSGDLLGTLDTFCQEEEAEQLATIQSVAEPVEVSGDLLGTLDTFCQEEEAEQLATIQSVAEPIEFSGDLLGTLDTFFFDEEAEQLATIQSASAPVEFSGDLLSTLDTLFQEEEAEQLATIQSVAEPVEVSGDLLGTLDTFCQEEEAEQLATIQSVAEPVEVSGDLLGTLDTFCQEEEVGQLPAIQSASEPVEVSGDLLGTLDTFCQDEKSSTIPIETSNDLPDLLDNFFDDFPAESILDRSGESIAISDDLSLDELPAPGKIFDETLSIQSETNLEQYSDLLIDGLETRTDSIEEEISEFSYSVESPSIEQPTILPPETLPVIVAETPTPAIPVAPVKRSIQIPVPLERLDKSAKQVVDTLLTARAVMNTSSQLQSQLARLTVLTRENAQFVTRLRQLQDDYALLRNLSDEQQEATNNVNLERYRQGYSTIVRLLENILRLSELGQEIETSTYQSSIRLDALDRSILQLKDGIETSRLVPFRNLTSRSKAILRDLTNRYGKPAELIVENEQIELDAGIIQQLEPALLHLLRNAYDHGLESIQQRLDAGKEAQGKIQISLQQRGNLYRVTIEDDGGGIDANLIHQIAKSKGFTLNQTRTNAELLAVLCQPGFSSNSTITEVSGRGVGMDVVVSQIASIGGKLSLETYPGYGTKFSIEVPAPQLLLPCVLFQVGDRIVALPTDNVLETGLLSSMTIESSETATGMCTLMLTNLRGEIPAFDLNNYWQSNNFATSKSSQRSFPDTAVCIRTQQSEDTPEIWSIADDLLGQVKLLINPLPSPLIAPVGLLGVSLQPDGKLISILDPIALSAMITSTSTQSADIELDELATQGTEPAKSSAPTILIVDDAAMIRRRLEASLNTYGFITYTCNDGLEALNWLQNNPRPDLVITDVEMPNMDGFTLIDRARQANINIPILVVSSRASEEWGKEARRLGATDYLNKGFATSELLQKVNSLLGLLVDA